MKMSSVVKVVDVKAIFEDIQRRKPRENVDDSLRYSYAWRQSIHKQMKEDEDEQEKKAQKKIVSLIHLTHFHNHTCACEKFKRWTNVL